MQDTDKSHAIAAGAVTSLLAFVGVLAMSTTSRAAALEKCAGITASVSMITKPGSVYAGSIESDRDSHTWSPVPIRSKIDGGMVTSDTTAKQGGGFGK
jgi:uncharacterized membrane protein